MKNIFDPNIEAFWRLITVFIVLYVVIINVSPELTSNWVWKYFIPILGIYYALIPLKNYFFELVYNSKEHKENK
jgi:hypothetical protein